MNTKRVFEIMKNKEIHDIYYEERPVWIQEVKDNVAKVGFMDNNEEKNVYIEDLYESNLYNS
ncbi:MAG: H-type small acid-soluble spore protein [Clostridia bacterium]